MRFLKYYERLESENWFIFMTDKYAVFEKENKQVKLSLEKLGILKRYNVDFYEFFKVYENSKHMNVLKYAKENRRAK